MNQRFEYFLLFYSLIVAGAVSAKTSSLSVAVLSVGAAAAFATWLTIVRAYVRHRHYKNHLRLHSDRSPTLLVKDLEGKLGFFDSLLAGQSRVWLIPYVIPPLCILSLVIGAVAIAFGWV